MSEEKAYVQLSSGDIAEVVLVKRGDKRSRVRYESDVCDGSYVAAKGEERAVENRFIRVGELMLDGAQYHKPTKALAMANLLDDKNLEEQAKAVGMSVITYKRARRVLAAAASDPDKFGDLPRMMDETGSVWKAYDQIDRRGGFRPTFERRGSRKHRDLQYHPKTQGQKNLARGQKDRMVTMLSTAKGISRGLPELDVLMALSVCSAEEVETWLKMSQEIYKAFKSFSLKLHGGKNVCEEKAVG